MKTLRKLIATAGALLLIAAGSNLLALATTAGAAADSTPGAAWTIRGTRNATISTTMSDIAEINGLPPGSYTVDAVANFGIRPNATNVGANCIIASRAHGQTPQTQVTSYQPPPNKFLSVSLSGAFTTTVKSFVRIECASFEDDTLTLQQPQLVVTMVQSLTVQPQYPVTTP